MPVALSRSRRPLASANAGCLCCSAGDADVFKQHTPPLLRVAAVMSSKRERPSSPCRLPAIAMTKAELLAELTSATCACLPAHANCFTYSVCCAPSTSQIHTHRTVTAHSALKIAPTSKNAVSSASWRSFSKRSGRKQTRFASVPPNQAMAALRSSLTPSAPLPPIGEARTTIRPARRRLRRINFSWRASSSSTFRPHFSRIKA